LKIAYIKISSGLLKTTST